jgi:glycine cleavage system H protein
MNVPRDLRYTKSHEWMRTEGQLIRVGITDHAQHELTDVVYVELPKVGQQLTKGSPMGVVESVKSTSDVYAPVTGTVESVNAKLESQPELVNGEPYGEGWLVVIKPSAAAEGDMGPEEYEKLIAK